MMRLIEFHEDEYMNLTVSDCTYRAVALLFDEDCAKNLLYRGNAYVRLDTECIGTIRPLRSEPDDSDYVFDLFSEAAESAAPVEKVSALAHSG
jgi:hypothetical protein